MITLLQKIDIQCYIGKKWTEIDYARHCFGEYEGERVVDQIRIIKNLNKIF